MDKSIEKEMSMGCLLGPFTQLPWSQRVAVSRMPTRPKKDRLKRRVIMDLSWPHDGRSVNDGIDKDRYLQQQIQLIYPTVDRLCRVAAQGGPGMTGYKVDMDRAFKQIFMDIIDWPLLGITWRDRIFLIKLL